MRRGTSRFSLNSSLGASKTGKKKKTTLGRKKVVLETKDGTNMAGRKLAKDDREEWLQSMVYDANQKE